MLRNKARASAIAVIEFCRMQNTVTQNRTGAPPDVVQRWNAGRAKHEIFQPVVLTKYEIALHFDLQFLLTGTILLCS